MESIVKSSVALVTGSSSDVGRETCRVLAREGASVVVSCKNKEIADEICRSLPGCGHSSLSYDITDFGAITEVMVEIRKRYARVPNILINCAEDIKCTPLLEETTSNIQEMLDVNFKSAFITSQAFCKELIAYKMVGSIINVASVTGLDKLEGMLAYSTSKAALETMTRCFAREMARHNIRVNAVVPGAIDNNGIVSSLQQNSGLGSLSTHRQHSPKGVAETIVFLASDRVSYINGAIIPASGLA